MISSARISPSQKWSITLAEYADKFFGKIIVTLQSGGGNPLVVLLATLVDFLFQAFVDILVIPAFL